MCFAAIITASIVLPSTLICMPFLFFYFRSLRKTYIKSSREIKRIESVTRSPMFVMMREALSGLPTIRSQKGAVEIFLNKFEALQVRTRKQSDESRTALRAARYITFR